MAATSEKRMLHLSELALLVVVAYAVVVGYTRVEERHALAAAQVTASAEVKPVYLPPPIRVPLAGKSAYQLMVAINAPGASTANPIPGIPTPDQWRREQEAHHGEEHPVRDTPAEREVCFHMLRSRNPAIRAEAADCPRGDRQ